MEAVDPVPCPRPEMLPSKAGMASRLDEGHVIVLFPPNARLRSASP